MEFNDLTFRKKVTRPIPCPNCNQVGLEIHELLIPITPELSAVEYAESEGINQMEVQVRQAVYLYCPSCNASTEGVVSPDRRDLTINPEGMRKESNNE